MDISYYINQFQTNLNVFEYLFYNVDAKQIAWKPSEEKWSLLEVLCHLYDEEKEDFRARLKSILENPETPFNSIDPQSWVKERNYAQQEVEQMLLRFIQERKNSITWIKTLKDVNWSNTYHHPKLGPMSAKYIIANWLAHDYLHIKQIIKLKYDYLNITSAQSLSYAGDW